MVCVCVLGIGVVAGAAALWGWRFSSLLLGGLIISIAAVVVYQVSRDVRSLTTRSEQTRRAAEEAEQHYIDVLWRILRVVEARDKFTKGHSERVGRLCEQLAATMGFDEDRCALMHQAGRLHDIGMIAVPDQILNSKHRIGVEGFRTVQKHSQIGYEVLRPLESLSTVLPAIRCHHERMNGTGYPAGLAGEDIPLEARILAVADAYDAMTHDRPQRPAMNPLSALNELQRCCPSGYDADCVDAMAELVHLPKLAEAFATRKPAEPQAVTAAMPAGPEAVIGGHA